MSDIDNQCVKLIENNIPPLRAGKYVLNVVQTTKIPDEDSAEYNKEVTFIVRGERFTLKSDEFHSVYPPPLLEGEFNGHIPHIVLNRTTVPWERSSNQGDCNPEENKATWLAVLMFNDIEAPVPQQMTVADLISGSGLPETHYSTFKTDGEEEETLEEGESLTDHCTVIDMPLSLFWQAAPTMADLQYLAQVREVSTANGPDHEQEKATYGVVLGNRIARTDTVSHCYLVSLENLEQLLPNDDGEHAPVDRTHVRIIVFRYWKFTANNRGETLRKLLEDLNKGQLEKSMPFRLHALLDGTVPDPMQVNEAYASLESGTLSGVHAQVLAQNNLHMGFVPLNHHLRSGGHTVSWYRGPLTPEFMPSVVKNMLPFSSPDKANQFDPKTGMFDVSYSAAWQLGQLLTLRNRPIASQIYHWRKETRKTYKLREEAKKFFEEQIQLCGAYRDALGNRERGLSMPEVPQEIQEWLGKLRLLHEVPFPYLIPDLRMLPPESLRWFHLDKNWVYALLDGAFSIGRHTSADMTEDERVIRDLILEAENKSRSIRKNAPIHTNFFNSSGHITGFILRSQVVIGWKDLQAFGFADAANEEQQLPILRLSILPNDVLLCLFDGEVKRLTLQEAPSQLHTGLFNEEAGLSAHLRRLNCMNPLTNEVATPNMDDCFNVCSPGWTEPGEQLGESIQIPMRRDNQTIKVAQASAVMLHRLEELSQIGDGKFTSAHYALQTVKGDVKVPYVQN